jgi:hypothetical protein
MYNYFTHEKREKLKEEEYQKSQKLLKYKEKRKKMNEDLLQNYEQRITNFVYDVCNTLIVDGKKSRNNG